MTFAIETRGGRANLIKTELVLIIGNSMIKLSKLADYGVALLTHLANAPRDTHSAQQVADATGIP